MSLLSYGPPGPFKYRGVIRITSPPSNSANVKDLALREICVDGEHLHMTLQYVYRRFMRQTAHGETLALCKHLPKGEQLYNGRVSEFTEKIINTKQPETPRVTPSSLIYTIF